MMTWRILPHLPAKGPLPRQFSATGRGTYQECFVVEFYPDEERRWVGNFQPGFNTHDFWILREAGKEVVDYHGSRHVLVRVGDAAYIIDPASERSVRDYNGDITQVIPIPELRLFLVADKERWEGFRDDEQSVWTTPRLANDGFANTQIRDHILQGDARRRTSDKWDEGVEREFTVDLRTGVVQGGCWAD